jgi:hypothetical protein
MRQKIRDEAEGIMPQRLVFCFDAFSSREPVPTEPVIGRAFARPVGSKRSSYRAALARVDPVRGHHGIDGDNFLFRVAAFQAFERSVLKSLRHFRNS